LETPPHAAADPPDPTEAPFLARQSYVQRRLGDAARLLPLVGVLLFLLPLLWLMNPDAPRSARGLIYVFAVWSGLIVAAGWLATRLIPNPPGAPERPDPSVNEP